MRPNIAITEVHDDNGDLLSYGKHPDQQGGSKLPTQFDITHEILLMAWVDPSVHHEWHPNHRQARGRVYCVDGLWTYHGNSNGKVVLLCPLMMARAGTLREWTGPQLPLNTWTYLAATYELGSNVTLTAN